MFARLTPPTPCTSPAKLSIRLPLISTSVRAPPRPRSDAVCADSVSAPTELEIVVIPALLFAEICCSSSIGVVAPDRWISSRVITVTGSAPSPSTRLMFDPVTSTRMSGVVACA